MCYLLALKALSLLSQDAAIKGKASGARLVPHLHRPYPSNSGAPLGCSPSSQASWDERRRRPVGCSMAKGLDGTWTCLGTPTPPLWCPTWRCHQL